VNQFILKEGGENDFICLGICKICILTFLVNSCGFEMEGGFK
jgi:hypothetical protein